jgi:1-acyl-sn-glycerol-3-phosphate acyltransferase
VPGEPSAPADTPPPPSRPRRRRRTSRARAGRPPARRDPFAARLRTLEREIERALANAGGEVDRGAAALLQEAGEQVLAFYADVTRAFLDGGVAAAFVRLRMVGTADVVDDFGFDAAFHARAQPLLRFLYERWWRVDVSGIRHVPRKGRALLVANHSGGLFPYDGLMIAQALRARRAGAGLVARPLVEDGAYHFPFAGSPLARLGVVRASAANAERLLAREEAAIVFPEGTKGSTKHYRERYRLQRFARGGFVSLALRTGAPIVPVAVIGAEEIYPVLARWQWLARLLGVPYVPVTPTFPWLGLLGLLPLPTKWRLVFGPPLDLAAEYGTAAHDDEVLVNRLQETVRERIQRMVIDALRERDSVFTG